MSHSSKYHTAEQNQKKHEAIDLATRELAFQYKAGLLSTDPNLLYNHIDNLHALLTELRRG